MLWVYNEIYGPGVTDGTIMKGGDYITLPRCNEKSCRSNKSDQNFKLHCKT